MDPLIVPLIVVGLPGYFVLQVLFPLRFDGAWRIATLLPLLVTLPAMLHATYALSQDSNLWPILVVLTAPCLFLYLCAVGLARYLTRRRPDLTAHDDAPNPLPLAGRGSPAQRVG